MTLMEFTGCTLTAFGPALSMFIITIMNDPVRVIILIASSFFWLLSLLFSSILWFIFPIKEYIWVGVCLSVLVQELFRYFLYILLRKAERGLKQFAVHSFVSSNKHMLSYVSGLGFGLMSGLFSLINILAEVGGPGTMGLRGGNSVFCLVSSIFTALTIFLHIFWQVLFFHGLNTENKKLMSYVFCSHLIVSEITLFNQYYYYVLTLSLVFTITMGTGFYAFKIAGGQLPFLNKNQNETPTTIN
ncbi:gamma-secretase subunit Aph-1 [Daktulosphaira vitifoliae]|uniref:gamma-secretase subunit Aph-1 n=1 Tax=Daktulosphaira vitifoliae TaxID=58002 RepID=UPI0021AA022F|nr:gamma-secretase subunit Aph-1 [Daktulosphaira vitifoliae]